MYLIDFHLHTKYSVDGHEEPDAIFERAYQMGMQEIAITDHLDFSAESTVESALNYSAVKKAVDEGREKYRGMLKIRMGVELGQPQHNPMEAERFYREKIPDFIIGSIHCIENGVDISQYDFQQVDFAQLYTNYLEDLIGLAKGYDFDVMGHVTYPLRYLFAQCGQTIDLNTYWEQYRVLFQILIQKGKGIELNTSGLRQAIGKPLPPLELLKLYRECGGEMITLGSDAHFAKDVAAGIRDGYALLEEAGFPWLTTFENRKPEFHPIAL